MGISLWDKSIENTSKWKRRNRFHGILPNSLFILCSLLIFIAIFNINTAKTQQNSNLSLSPLLVPKNIVHGSKWPQIPSTKVKFPESLTDVRVGRGVEEGRKASPDVQDIIDGIVKLLGGKIHPPTPSPNNTTLFLPTNNRPYNLFNPKQPLYNYNQHPHIHNIQHHNKPIRINNRGPPPQSIHQNNNNNPTSTESFEAIPIQALLEEHQQSIHLNNHHNNNTNIFGPPFKLNDHQPPFKVGVPIPQQLVPIYQNNNYNQQTQYQYQQHQQSTPSHLNQNYQPQQHQQSSPSHPNQNNQPQQHFIPQKQFNIKLNLQNDTRNIPQTIPKSPLEEDQNKTTTTINPSTSTHSEKESIEDDEDEFEGETPYKYPPILLPSINNLQPTIVNNYESNQSQSETITAISPTTTTTLFETVSKVTQPPTTTTLKSPIFNKKQNNIGIGSSTSLGSIHTPPLLLRPGLVLPDVDSKNESNDGGIESNNNEEDKYGDVFHVTVTAKQNYGESSVTTGEPIIGEVITSPSGDQQFVSIDGKRTYFPLHSSSIPPPSSNPHESIRSHPGIVGPPTHPFANPTATTQDPLKRGSGSGIGSKISTSLRINDNKSPILRRPPSPPGGISRRPSIPPPPPIRIDTCIVGDDTTCSIEDNETCKTELGVSSCMCKPGYARKRHREPCKSILSLVLSLRIDKLGELKLKYNPDYFNKNSEIYERIQWETKTGLEGIFGDGFNGNYVGCRFDSIGYDGRNTIVNSTILLIDNLYQSNTNQVKREIQKHLIDTLTKDKNILRGSQLRVEGPISAISGIYDFNECEKPDLIDCDTKAMCVNTYGSFECKCNSGYGDKYEGDHKKSGRKCESCNSKLHCNGRGECLIQNGEKVCKCSGNYYGSGCDIDGEVLGVAIGASVSAILIIGLTLACLCMWSRRWKREEEKAAIMSRTLFGGGGYNYTCKNNTYSSPLTMDERLRWAQVDPSLPNQQNLYMNDGIGYHLDNSSSQIRRSDTCESTLDDCMIDERFNGFNKGNNIIRPKSRSSQFHGGYYDVDVGDGVVVPPSDIYGTRTTTGGGFIQFPAQFCVPTSPMNPYPHSSRGFYN